MTTRLAVLGSPIAHSKSPALHRAAYGVLGLDWRYEAIEVAQAGLDGFLEGLDSAWRGLSLTMPLKREVLPALTGRAPLVDEVGAANTVLLREGRREGFNTDVGGIITAFREAGVEALESVQVLGAGATTASVLSAVARLGARRVTVSARDVVRAAALEPLAARLGIALTLRPLADSARPEELPDAVVSTLPGGVDAGIAYPERVRRSAALFDVAYDPWPSALARQWQAAGGTVISGLSMLLHQAVGQVRIFVAGDPDAELPGEAAVVAAMRSAVGL
ncbi:MAG TPA: shikimate dehydrogenase [Pseudolysinimonas sp.]|nr:shikimate dehydrogenase [Pseudolysinimonas sp.]